MIDMKKNIKTLLILFLISLVLYTPNVFAQAEIKDRTHIEVDGKPVNKYYDNEVSGNKNLTDTAGKITLIIDGKEYVGFCVDFGMILKKGEAESISVEEYFANGIGDAKAKELVKKLTEYIRFGYGSTGRTTNKYYLATQQLIWEAINSTGFYTSDYYIEQWNDPNAFKTKFTNFRWSNDGGATALDISKEINDIKKSIIEYYKTPSFCSSQERLEIEVGETIEYTDNNNVLSEFNVICDDGIECKVENNKLKVTAINEAGSNDIKFSKTDKNEMNNYIYRHSNGQGVLLDSGTLEPVSCEFGIDSFKNEKTADMKIIYIITIGLFCGVMAYITYYTKKSLDVLK